MSSSSRRNLLLGSAAVVAGMSVGGMSKCQPVTGGTQILQPVIDAVQKVVATGCGWVPNVATMIAIVSMFPGLAGAGSIADELLKEVSDFLCKQFTGGGGTKAAIEAATSAAALRGTLKDGGALDLHGYVWNAASNKFVAF